jgi:hypothetical protein
MCCEQVDRNEVSLATRDNHVGMFLGRQNKLLERRFHKLHVLMQYLVQLLVIALLRVPVLV